MISKLIVWGDTRGEAINRMRRALSEYVITGVKTTVPFHLRVMNNAHFIRGDFDTNFIDKVFFKEEKERILLDTDVAMIVGAIVQFSREKEESFEKGKTREGIGGSFWKYAARPGFGRKV
jgi:acetyl-CoA carboxylase biotin carboxylase subunit